MAYTKTGEIHNGMQGGWIEFGTFTLDPANLTALAQGTDTVAITGLASGDQVFVNPQTLTTKLVCVGTKVTGTDELTVYLLNVDDTNAVNGGSVTYDCMIIHNS